MTRDMVHYRHEPSRTGVGTFQRVEPHMAERVPKLSQALQVDLHIMASATSPQWYNADSKRTLAHRFRKSAAATHARGCGVRAQNHELSWWKMWYRFDAAPMFAETTAAHGRTNTKSFLPQRWHRSSFLLLFSAGGHPSGVGPASTVENLNVY